MAGELNASGDTVAGFVDKWRARWPEWPLAEVFVPAAQRTSALAWFALRNELTEAAWGGSDPRPGEAKLAWWSEELHGWSQGRRRHPLGIALQRQPAAWASLGASLPSLLGSRERAGDADEAVVAIEPFAEGLAAVSATLFSEAATAPPARGAAMGLLAERVLMGGDAAAPLQVLARSGSDAAPQAAARAWANDLLARWPDPHEGALPGRMHAAMVRERLRRFAEGRTADAATPAWRMLLSAWRAARR